MAKVSASQVGLSKGPGYIVILSFPTNWEQMGTEFLEAWTIPCIWQFSKAK